LHRRTGRGGALCRGRGLRARPRDHRSASGSAERRAFVLPGRLRHPGGLHRAGIRVPRRGGLDDPGVPAFGRWRGAGGRRRNLSVAYKKSAISAAQIISAATRVIARKGYARTSLNDIAREAGMSKGAVHYHFSTKEALVAKVLETACDAVAERTKEAWQRGGDNPFEALRASVRELWAVRTSRSDEVAVVADLLAQALHDESLRPQLAGYYRFASAQTTQHLVTVLASFGLRPKVSPELVPR